MRTTPGGIVGELRDGATEAATETGLPRELSASWEAADYIEHLLKALRRIEGMGGEAALIAAWAVDPIAWIKGHDATWDADSMRLNAVPVKIAGRRRR